MAELIDKGALLESMGELLYLGQSIEEVYADFETLIDEQPTTTEAEIRAKAISDFQKEIRDWQIDIQDNEHDSDKYDFVFERIYEIADQLKEEQ